MPVAIISFIALAASIFLTVREVRASRVVKERKARSALAWAIVFMALQAFIGVYAAIGLVQDDIVSALVLNVVLTGCAWVSIARRALIARLRALVEKGDRFPHPIVAGVVLVMLAALFAGLALEIPSNHDFSTAYPLCLLLEWALIAATMLGLYLIAQRRGSAPSVLAVALYILGVAEHFIITFKSMPIQPGDLTALSTAMAVAGTGYVYSLTAFCLYGLAFAAASMLLCQIAGAIQPRSKRSAQGEQAPRNRRVFVASLVAGILLLAGVGAHVTLVDYYNTLNITIYTWRPLQSYYRQGFLPTFISGAQTIKPPVPDGYNMDDAEELMDEYAAEFDSAEGSSAQRAEATAQFDEEKPTVIAIMNETFSDLSIYQQMHAGYEGPQFFKSLSDTLQRGTLYVSAYGGGTCNTEFEFLTGNSMAHLGSGVYPYTLYDLTETESLAGQFKSLGYTTTAMHPNHGTNWNRENVYRDLGFDNFLTIQDFEGAETLRGMVTDAATYDKILELLEQDSNPQFIFDVTMQNHSGYKTGLVPADKQVNLSVDGESNAEINEYVSLIQQSDEALERFIAQLRQLNRKVVVVFFGDHQPYFPDTYNDRWFTDEDEATHAMRLWQTDYIIWANYDVAGCDQTSTEDDLSTNYLGAELMELIGAPMSTFQKAQVSLRDALPAVNSTGYLDRSDKAHLSSDARGAEGSSGDGAEAAQAHHDAATIQYFNLFGDGKDVYTHHQQAAANETNPNQAPKEGAAAAAM